MNVSIKHNVIKKILWSLMVIILLSNFTFPKYVYAFGIDMSLIGNEDMNKEDAKGEAAAVGEEAQNKLNEILDAFNATIGGDEEAEEQATQGGDLFTPITDLIVSVADNVMGTLQSVFLERNNLSNLITAESIKVIVNDTDTLKDNLRPFYVYMIKYSPAAIFSGNIPAFDINFFAENEDNSTKVDVQTTEMNFNLIR